MKAKITNLDESRVTLTLEDGQVLSLPAAAVSGQIKPGQEALLAVFPVGGEEAGRQQLARDFLNEILRG
ncbi:MAG: hypothetical protein WC641_03300 [Patescibacteria group bacterium]